ncbi:MAG: hypothetical protein IJ678_08285, partial [Kiritimatiellae bacterium]|nr:hypothetical protein [Kiritimatiellia bacterium]
MTNPLDPRNVVAVLHLSYGSHRDVLGGVFRRAARFGWSVRVVDYGLWRDRATMREILSEWADGVIITGPDEPHVAEWLRGWKGPLVAVGTPIPAGAARAEGTAFVGLDETAIARAGADFLLSLGRFRSFGFVRGSDGYAAAKRAEGFVRRIAERGGEAQVFDPDTASRRAEPGPLAEWLASLPAPRAVMVSS